jgi:glycosyltransferase involved in cell wall biosynthesis
MKVLITTDSYYPQVNGASVFGQRLAADLKGRGHDVLVVAPGTSLKSGYSTVAGVSLYGVSSVPVFFYKGMRIAHTIDLDGTTRRVLRAFEPDLVHAQGHFTVSKAVIRNAQEAGIPVIGTNHFMPENLTHYAHLPASLDGPLQHWMWGQFREVFEGLSVVTTPTARAAAYMTGNGFAGEIQVVSNGIDLKRFHPQAVSCGLRDKYSLPADTPLLLYVGRLDKEKNLDLVLQAVSGVPATVPIHFAIAGTGARRQALEAVAAEFDVSERVTFLGFVSDEDLSALYAAAHCFVMAGTAELQSIVTMEAMASGLPVLAANAVALPELVHSGRNGYLFEPGNAGMLSEQIWRLFTDRALRDRMGQESLEIIQQHAVERTLEKFEAFYAGAVQQQSPVRPHPAGGRGKRLIPSFSR